MHPLGPALPRLFGVLLLALAALILGIASGSTDIAWNDLVRALTTGETSTHSAVVLEVRFPRVMTAFFVGALLAIAGTLLQVLVRNPLADPYVTGTAGGAAAAFLFAAMLNVPASLHPLAAFAGALVSTAGVGWLARLGSHSDTTRLLLIGIMFAAGWGAVIALALSVAPATQLPGLLFWLLGDLNASDGWPIAAITCVLGLSVALAAGRPLNLLAFGATRASALGVSVHAVQALTFLLAALLTAVAVSLAGPIGFVGLVAPHLVRRTVSPDHRVLLPGSALAGGALLVLADTLARTVATPVQLPAGVLTALIGVPLFVALLTSEGRRHAG